ncbi:MAG: DUF3596 domain-containing protein [Pseudomonadota bacterium]
MARGVTVRRYSSGKTAIRIAFTYRGVECKETLRLKPTRANIRFAETQKALIDAEIAKGTFRYDEFFPDSPKCALFGQAPSQKTMDELFDEWLLDVERAVSYSTFRSYRSALRAHWRPALGQLRIRDVTPEHLRRVIRAHGGKAKSVRNVFTVARLALNRAVEDGILESSPADRVRATGLVTPDQRRSDYEVDPFDRKEIDAVVRAADELYGPAARAAILFRFFSGVRTGEFFALEWGDVSIPDATARIERTITAGRLKDRPKSDAGKRTLQLLPKAVEALKIMREISRFRGERVFLNRALQPFNFYNQWNLRLWEPVLKHAGVRHRAAYQARHTFASQLLSEGENIFFVSQQLGHKTVEITQQHYARWIDKNGGAKHQWKSTFGA